MRIDQITLTNFKNFSHATVDFEPGVNLFVGGNGSGKTTILEAVNVAAGAFFNGQGQKMQRLIELEEVKLTEGIRESIAKIHARSEIPNASWSRIWKNSGNVSEGIKSISDVGNQYFNAFSIPDDRTVAPIIAYYSTQRLFKDSSRSERQKYDAANGRRNGYLLCLKETAIKSVLNEWMVNATTLRATLGIKEIERTDNILENVEEAIRRTLIYFGEAKSGFDLKVYPNLHYKDDFFINYDREHDLPLSYYSDGFRNLIYLIFDLVWRASHLNPWLTLSELTEQLTGVVTIDEIDLHLHPKWQAKAIDLLQHFFPNVQFFITTHSPTVVANFNHGQLYIVDNHLVRKHENDFFGKQINDVLVDILGAPDRHVPTQRKINLLFDLIDQNLPDKYNPLLVELTELLGQDDPEIQRAIMLIDINEEN